MIAPRTQSREQTLRIIDAILDSAKQEHDTPWPQNNRFTRQLRQGIKELFLADLYTVDAQQLPHPVGDTQSFSRLYQIEAPEDKKKRVYDMLRGPSGYFLLLLRQVTLCDIDFQQLGSQALPSHITVHVTDSENRAEVKLAAARNNLDLIFNLSPKIYYRQRIVHLILRRSDFVLPGNSLVETDRAQSFTAMLKDCTNALLNSE